MYYSKKESIVRHQELIDEYLAGKFPLPDELVLCPKNCNHSIQEF